MTETQVERNIGLEALRNGKTLESVVNNVIRLGGYKLLECEGTILHSLTINCLPKINNEAHVKIYAEFDYSRSLIGNPCKWLLHMEDYATNEAALARYNNLRKKIKDGKCKVVIMNSYETSHVKFF